MVIFAFMKKIITLLTVCLFGLASTKAQYSYDFGIQTGGSLYTGEIGGNGEEASPFLLDAKLTHMRLNAGAFFRYNFTKSFGLKMNVNYARISAEDSTSEIVTQIARNLHFRTEIFELSLVGEYTFLTIGSISRGSRSRVGFNSYVFGGAGAALYYPYAEYKNQWYSLRPLQTEGVENAYDEMTIVIPFGLGASFTFNQKFRLGFEAGYRMTFTDYLDDVSTDYAFDSELPFEESKIFANRSDEAYAKGEADLPNREFFSSGSIKGNPDTYDGYLLMQFTVSYVIQNSKGFYKAKYNSIINRKRKRTKF